MEAQQQDQQPDQLDQHPAQLNNPAGMEAVQYKAIKLPQFWEEDPALWFAQIEAIFNTYSIQSQNKRAQYVIGQLPYKILTQVADLTREPGPTPYQALRERLISAYSQSQERKILRLLEETQLGDLRPSQLLRQMQTLAGNATSLDVIRTIWLRALPTRVRGILAAISQDDITQLATVADKILEVDTPHIVAAVHQPSEEGIIKQLKEQLQGLREEISQLRNSRSRPRSSSRPRYNSEKKQQDTSKPKKPSEDEECFYHRRFKSKAHKCRQPCTWTLNKDESLN